jgi:hypothetical protein
MTRDVLTFPKPQRLRHKGYIAWIRRQPCLIDRAPAQAHHSTSVGAFGSDLRAVPLCHRHHQELHRMGRVRFEEKYRLDLTEEILSLLERYISARGEE